MMNCMRAYLPVAIISVVLVACTGGIYVRKADSFLNAQTAEEKSFYMAESFRSYHNDKSGKVANKSEMLIDFRNWDAHLQPDVNIYAYKRKKDTLFIKFVERNDFSRLISFPGWRASMKIAFDPNKLISETIYFADTANSDLKKWLQPAISWLQLHSSDELNQVYKNGQIVKTEEAAKLWKTLLQRWIDHKRPVQ
jgi:hypothetical protein